VNPASPPALADDLLRGAQAIAAFLGCEAREIHYLEERRKSGRRVSWPIFKVDGRYHARRSTLLAFIEEQERAAAGPDGAQAAKGAGHG
jgi:hypothetical protein